MDTNAKITKLELVVFEYKIQDMGKDYNGFNEVYEKGSVNTKQMSILKMHTNTGITAEVPGSEPYHLALAADYLLGKNPFEREKIYGDLKRGLRHTDRRSISMVDVALWDFLGRCQGLPIYRLLGGWRKRIKAYASTYHGDENGGLGTPEDYADFAEQCSALGYRGFKIHGWGNAPIEREIANVHAVGKRVGDHMDLFLDPACEYPNWSDALRIGKACDEQDFFWLEDPYQDGGVSIFAHKLLREKIKTPILQCEHIFGLEQHVDFIVNGGTDFVRAGCREDGGITGVLKVAHAAEGFGLDVELHSGGMAHRHIIASLRNTNYYELALVHPKVKNTKPPIMLPEFTDELENVDKDGCVAVPEGPGLGVELDWDWIKAHTVDTVVFE
jgi:L-alanine-DL-glutamate epimerase-like enolase superfamily enzyme